MENRESTKRQYDLRERALALGWRADRVIVIDSDLGQSGASAVDRKGFQRLIAEVGLVRASIVMGFGGEFEQHGLDRFRLDCSEAASATLPSA